MNKLNILFQLLCIAGAVGMTLFCVLKYLSNESVVSVSLRVFHDAPDDVYPSISICFLHNDKYGPFVDTNGLIREDIAKMMTGRIKYNKSHFKNISYENMTMLLPLEKMTYMILRKDSGHRIMPLNYKHFKTYGDGKLKCFTHDVEFLHGKIIKRINIRLTKTKQIGDSQMTIFFHHPGQLLRNGNDPVLEGVSATKANIIRINVQSVRVLQNREHGKETCNPASFNDDKNLFEKSINIYNCTAKYKGQYTYH